MLETALRGAAQLQDTLVLRRYICGHLRSLGLRPELMGFGTPLAAGINIMVDIPSGRTDSSRPRRLLGAHYDGPDLHDNLGGVLCLQVLASFLCRQTTTHAWRLAFWDAEERFQQGSRAYLRSIEATAAREEAYIDFDGLGIGPFLFSRAVTERRWQSRTTDPEFLFDGDAFCSAGVPTFHVFSGPEDFGETYMRTGLVGCYSELQRRERQSLRSWRKALACCCRGLTRVIAAWESLPFGEAFAKVGVLCPR